MCSYRSLIIEWASTIGNVDKCWQTSMTFLFHSFQLTVLWWKQFGREILNIVTLCLYKDAGCQWMDAVKNAEVSTKITLILDKLINKMSSKSWSKDCLKCFFFISLSNNSDWNMNLMYLISPFKTIKMDVLEIWRCKILNLQQY